MAFLDNMLSAADKDTIERIDKNLCDFEAEVRRVHDEVVIPTWQTELHGLRHTLYGYIMMCFSYIDLFSTLWKGNTKDNQTVRMTQFMQKYMRMEYEVANVAVQLWRHKLMHTTRPRHLKIPATSMQYSWLLHWSDRHLPAEQHLKFNATDTNKILAIGLLYLLKDVQSAWKMYTKDLQNNTILQKAFSTVRPAIEEPEYKPK